MKRFSLFLFISAMFLAAEIANAQTASDYYLPLVVGNYVSLSTQPIPPNSSWAPRTTTHAIEGTDLIQGQIYFREVGREYLAASSDVFQAFWLRKDLLGNVALGAVSVAGSTNIDSAVIYVPNGLFFLNQYLTPGYSRYMGSNYKDSIISITETVQVPAGTFTNCLEICSTNLDSVGNITLREYTYYAKGIGEVKDYRDIPANQTHTDVLNTYNNVTSVRDKNSTSALYDFALQQNYPNPFNPSTNISFSIPSKSFVSLNVFDLTGKEVVTLVNEVKSAGTYTATFNAVNMPSGVYYYRLQAGNINEIKKMLLLK